MIVGDKYFSYRGGVRVLLILGDILSDTFISSVPYGWYNLPPSWGYVKQASIKCVQYYQVRALMSEGVVGVPYLQWINTKYQGRRAYIPSGGRWGFRLLVIKSEVLVRVAGSSSGRYNSSMCMRNT